MKWLFQRMAENRFPKRRRPKATFKIVWLLPDDIYQTLKEIGPENSLEGLMPKLKFQYFGCLMWRANSLEQILMLGKIEGRRRRGQERMRWLDGIIWHHQLHAHEFEKAPGVGDGQGSLGCCSSWGWKESDMTEQLNWIHATTWKKLENMMLRLK